ncbi:MAG: EF-hand domain-containing protein [Sphingobium sp.]|uniref:EF-hand domain-containing protein n=1 Tax=Sphingobium sp. TaxID=1912891 RepID=UPI0029AFE8FA|nr:EF-hand domain-containing protein [Sphingobium sp.]MDX3909991.1 EF-hand domain-containing protein [Sphingobium sp.]
MGRYLAGIAAGLLLTAAALFWWQSRSQATAEAEPIPMPVAAIVDDSLPEGDENAFGAAPPMPASASPASREQRRFARYDRNRDGIITRQEMLSTRTKAFKALDKDGDNLLSFEEWAVATSERYVAADADKDGKVTPPEFAATAPKAKPKAACRC